MQRGCVGLLLVATAWQVAAVPVALHDGVTRAGFEQVGEMTFAHPALHACMIPPPSQSPGDLPEAFFVFSNSNATVWNLGSGEVTPLEPPSGPAAGCAVAQMDIGRPLPAQCIGVATVDRTDSVKIYCERLAAPGYEIFAAFHTDRDTRAIAALTIGNLCTMWAFSEWTMQEIELRVFDVATQEWVQLGVIHGMGDVHRLRFVDDPLLNLRHLLAADMSGGRVLSIPLGTCVNPTGATQVADVPGARSLATAVFPAEAEIRVYVATGTSTVVVLEQTNSDLRVLREFEVSGTEGNKAMNGTLEVAVCGDHLLIVGEPFEGEPGVVSHYRLTSTGEEWLEDLPAMRSAALAPYQPLRSDQCEFVVAALNAGEPSLHYVQVTGAEEGPQILV